MSFKKIGSFSSQSNQFSGFGLKGKQHYIKIDDIKEKIEQFKLNVSNVEKIINQFEEFDLSTINKDLNLASSQIVALNYCIKYINQFIGRDPDEPIEENFVDLFSRIVELQEENNTLNESVSNLTERLDQITSRLDDVYNRTRHYNNGYMLVQNKGKMYGVRICGAMDRIDESYKTDLTEYCEENEITIKSDEWSQIGDGEAQEQLRLYLYNKYLETKGETEPIQNQINIIQTQINEMGSVDMSTYATKQEVSELESTVYIMDQANIENDMLLANRVSLLEQVDLSKYAMKDELTPIQTKVNTIETNLMTANSKISKNETDIKHIQSDIETINSMLYEQAD